MKYVKMRHTVRDEIAEVADFEVEIWQAHGFEVINGIQAENKAEAEAKASPHPLDQDGDGKPGGSLPDAVAPRRRGRKPKGQA